MVRGITHSVINFILGAVLPSIRILIADDHPVVRRHFRRLLEACADCEVCGEANDGVEAVELAFRLTPDVVVLDHSMPRLNGLEAARRIMVSHPEIRVVLVSMHDVELLKRGAAEVGVMRWIHKANAAKLLCATVLSVVVESNL